MHDDVPALPERFRALSQSLPRVVFWRQRSTPAEELATLAEAAADLGVDTPDIYGVGGPVERLEDEVAALLGKPAAALFPTGVMAQQSMLRVWCDLAGSRGVALPDLSHLLTHEADGPRRLHGFEFDHLTTGRQLPTAENYRSMITKPAAVLIELPLRDAGCILPTWDELCDFTTAVRLDNVALHLDGARLWECQSHFARPLDEIAGLFDSVYVSLYKVLGAPAGAVVAGPAEAIERAKLWRKRMGGTLYSLYPLAVAGLVGLRDELPKVGAYVAWARELSQHLQALGVLVTSDATNTLEIFCQGDADQINQRVLRLCERERTVVSPLWRPSDAPGMVTNELACQAAALDHEPATVARWFAEALGLEIKL